MNTIIEEVRKLNEIIASEKEPNIIRYLRRAALFDQLKDYKKSVRDYNQILFFEPENVTALVNRSMNNLDLEEFSKTIPDCEKLINLPEGRVGNGDLLEAYYTLGTAYFNLKDFEKTVINFTKAIEIDPNDIAIIANRGFAYVELGRFEEAENDLSRSLQINETASVYVIRSMCYIKNNKYVEAIKDCTRAIELSPEDPYSIDAYTNRASALIELKDYKKAIEDCSFALTIVPNHVNSFVNRSVAYKLQKEYKKCFEDASRVLKMCKQDKGKIISALLNRAFCYLQWKEYDKSIIEYKKVLDIDPSRVNINKDIAFIYEKKKDFRNTLKYYKSYLLVHPNDTFSLESCAFCYMKLKEYRSCIFEYSKLIDLIPEPITKKWIPVFNNRAFSMNEIGEFEKAIKDLKRIVDMDPLYSYSYVNLGVSYRGLKMFEKSLEYLNKSIEIDDKTNKNSYLHRGYTYQDLSRFEEAIEDFKKALSIDENFEPAKKALQITLSKTMKKKKKRLNKHQTSKKANFF